MADTRDLFNNFNASSLSPVIMIFWVASKFKEVSNMGLNMRLDKFVFKEFLAFCLPKKFKL
jgi:hypothetical protein